MEDGSAVILSVAKYYSPSGKAIQDTGVTPSVAVAEVEAAAADDDNPQATQPVQTPPPGEDMLLKKAIEVVTNGKTDIVSAPQGTGNSQTSPALTPLNVPRPNKQ